MPQGALIIATAACRDDGITPQFIPISYPAVASMDVVAAMQEAAKEINPGCEKQGLSLHRVCFIRV